MTAQTQHPSDHTPATITGVFTADDSYAQTTLSALFREAEERKRGSSLNLSFRSIVDLKELVAGQDILAARADQQIKLVHAALLILKGGSYKNFLDGCMCQTVLRSLLRRKLPLRQDDVEQFLSLLIREMKIYPISELPTLQLVSQVAKFIDRRGMSKKTRQQLQQLTKVYHRGAGDAPTRKSATASKRSSKHSQNRERVRIRRRPFFYERKDGSTWTLGRHGRVN